MKHLDEITTESGHIFSVHYCNVENIYIITSEVTGIYELILHTEEEKEQTVEFLKKAYFA